MGRMNEPPPASCQCPHWQRCRSRTQGTIPAAGEVAGRTRLPLALHVDYWDYIGWIDKFAKPQYTQRQKAYAKAAGSRLMVNSMTSPGRSNQLSISVQ